VAAGAASAASASEAQLAHTDHPLRHFDRTCPACVADGKPWAQHPLRTLHACVETLASAFKGYLPWPEEKRDAVVRGHEALIEDTMQRADACMTIIEHGERIRSQSAGELKVGKCANEGKCECDLPQCLYPGSPCVAVGSSTDDRPK